MSSASARSRIHSETRRPPCARRRALRLALLALVGFGGCRCSRLEATVNGQTFTRCAEASAPAERDLSIDKLALRFQDRKLAIDAPRPLTVAAFTGPLAAPFANGELAALRASGASLALWIGGLGETAELAKENLARIAGTGLPTLFVAGGLDRLELVDATFAALEGAARDRVFHVSGLREIAIGSDRFVVVPGAALGRYAVDERGCGFTLEDLDAIRKDVGEGGGRTWLLSWNAPAGLALTESFGATEAGSAELRAFALELGAKGGVFAFPEVHAGAITADPFTVIAPRLEPSGALRADGAYARGGFARFVLAPSGPQRAP